MKQKTPFETILSWIHLSGASAFAMSTRHTNAWTCQRTAVPTTQASGTREIFFLVLFLLSLFGNDFAVLLKTPEDLELWLFARPQVAKFKTRVENDRF
ncbi:MAG: hypothetical protein HUJ26_15160 [Planctomycetaceae bacterium]|nr:hypothetical protein [Planctomycetaceae bacterium]